MEKMNKIKTWAVEWENGQPIDIKDGDCKKEKIWSDCKYWNCQDGCSKCDFYIKNEKK
jgi:hypothetical protein